MVPRIVAAGVWALVALAGTTARAREPAPPADGWLDVLHDRVPLLFSADFLFASAPAFEAAAVAFAAGGSLREIRAAATRGYAEGQRQPLARVGGVFTNPSDRRWARR